LKDVGMESRSYRAEFPVQRIRTRLSMLCSKPQGADVQDQNAFARVSRALTSNSSSIFLLRFAKYRADEDMSSDT
jgi:hypothetical protein